MRKAFFVIGAESSGTRMLTKAFISIGCYGDGGHYQKLDMQNFEDTPDLIVFRRSLPHAHKWPAVKQIAKKMKRAGYEVKIIGVMRDARIVVASQLRNQQHARTEQEALQNIGRANKIITASAHMVVEYENFVTDKLYREVVFADLGLEHPSMYFFNGNAKYENIVA